MIVYGTRAKSLLTESVRGTCPNCGADNRLVMVSYVKYVHVFWIPFFPFQHSAVCECANCHQVREKKSFDEALSTQFDYLKAKRRLPLWSFSGLMILLGFIGYSVINNHQNEKRNASFVQCPLAGDVYEVRNESKQYTLLKIIDCHRDSIFVKLHQYETNKISGLKKLKEKGEQGYDSTIYMLDKQVLIEMLDAGDIVGIQRN